MRLRAGTKNAQTCQSQTGLEMTMPTVIATCIFRSNAPVMLS